MGRGARAGGGGAGVGAAGDAIIDRENFVPPPWPTPSVRVVGAGTAVVEASADAVGAEGRDVCVVVE